MKSVYLYLPVSFSRSETVTQAIGMTAIGSVLHDCTEPRSVAHVLGDMCLLIRQRAAGLLMQRICVRCHVSVSLQKGLKRRIHGMSR